MEKGHFKKHFCGLLRFSQIRIIFFCLTPPQISSKLFYQPNDKIYLIQIVYILEGRVRNGLDVVVGQVQVEEGQRLLPVGRLEERSGLEGLLADGVKAQVQQRQVGHVGKNTLFDNKKMVNFFGVPHLATYISFPSM